MGTYTRLFANDTVFYVPLFIRLKLLSAFNILQFLLHLKFVLNTDKIKLFSKARKRKPSKAANGPRLVFFELYFRPVFCLAVTFLPLSGYWNLFTIKNLQG